jgi:hypothetical protein
MEKKKTGNKMKLFFISQNINHDYDTYSDAVVCAKSKEEARKINPAGFYPYDEKTKTFHWWSNIGTVVEQYEPSNLCGTWANKLEDVKVEYIGEAKKGMKKGVICSSFHAG